MKQGRVDIMRFATDYSHDNIDKEWNKWHKHTLQLQGIEVTEEPEAASDDENDTKRRRRSR